MSVGFKLSAALLERLSGLSEETVVDTAARTLDTVREMVGDHVQHNAYFIDFPANVPDTFDFWTRCIAEALADDASRDGTLAQLRTGTVDLLTLPSYGRYQHTYAEMLAAHDELIAAAGDRVTVLHLGGTPDDEVTALYLALAGSTTPLGDEDLRDLRSLAGHCVNGPQPEAIPVRENRAIVNDARLDAGADLLLDTVTDVLRLACALSDGDVTLREPTRFRSLSRPIRRALLAGLDAVVAAAPAKLADVSRAPRGVQAPRRAPPPARVPALAARRRRVRRRPGREGGPVLRQPRRGTARRERRHRGGAAADGRPGQAVPLPGPPAAVGRTQDERDAVVAAAEQVAPQVSGRVLLSVREHFQNRVRETGERRVFVNRLGRAWVATDTRPPVPQPEVRAPDRRPRRRDHAAASRRRGTC